MTARECVCGTEIRDRWLCHGCETRCRNNLTELVDLTGDLHVALARQVRMSDRAEAGRAAETPLVFSTRVAETLHNIRESLVDWTRDIAASTGMPLPPNNAVARLVDFLTAALPNLAAHDRASQLLASEARHWRWLAHRAVDLQPRQITLGPCPETIADTGERCHGSVRLTVPVEEHLPGRVTCRVCGSEWTGEQWPRLAARIDTTRPAPDPVLDLESAAVALGVSLSTVRRWLRLGLLGTVRPGYVRISAAWACREQLRERRRVRLAQYAVCT